LTLPASDGVVTGLAIDDVAIYWTVDIVDGGSVLKRTDLAPLPDKNTEEYVLGGNVDLVALNRASAVVRVASNAGSLQQRNKASLQAAALTLAPVPRTAVEAFAVDDVRVFAAVRVATADAGTALRIVRERLAYDAGARPDASLDAGADADADAGAPTGNVRGETLGVLTTSASAEAGVLVPAMATDGPTVYFLYGDGARALYRIQGATDPLDAGDGGAFVRDAEAMTAPLAGAWALALAGTTLYFGAADGVYALSKSAPPMTAPVRIAALAPDEVDGGEVHAIFVDAEHVYFTVRGVGRVRRVALDGGARWLIAEGQPSASVVAAGKWIVWSQADGLRLLRKP
jgi:hypothetical protein